MTYGVCEYRQFRRLFKWMVYRKTAILRFKLMCRTFMCYNVKEEKPTV